jgi:hypothetical protein
MVELRRAVDLNQKFPYHTGVLCVETDRQQQQQQQKINACAGSDIASILTREHTVDPSLGISQRRWSPVEHAPLA